MKKKQKYTLQFKIKILLILIMTFGFAVIVGRLVKLQVFDGKAYAAMALNQQLSVGTVTPMRGIIYDRNMVPLAQSATVWDVTASPKDIKSDVQRGSIADNLSQILKLDRQTVYNLLNNQSSYKVIAKKIDKATADQITQYKKEHNVGCIGLITDSKRFYPFGNFASQIIGFTGTDSQGLCGVEAQYDSVLKGIPGQVISAKKANGSDITTDYTDYIPAKNGSNLVLTIDETVQNYLEAGLAKAVRDNNVTNKATGIVMNVKTGEILGMATEPSFDLNDPFTVVDQGVKAQLAALSGDALTKATNNALQDQWRNKAVSDTYQPGSVFKVITSAAGIEEAKVKENDYFNDPGHLTIGDTTIHDWNKMDNGRVTFKQAFEQSWNVVFAQLGLNMGAKSFFRYFSSFGLTQKTGIDLPGEAGSIYLNESALNNQVNLAEAAFGQGNALTAIQMITAISAAANGGYLVQPHMVKAITAENGNVVKTFPSTVKRQVISSETSAVIRDLLQKEVEEGSGKNAYVAGYQIGGKTGTAQRLPEKTLYVSSFCGVAPMSDPEIAVIVILDTPNNPVSIYGSVIAAPVAGDIFAKILPYLGVEPHYTAAELAALEIQTPPVAGKGVADAKNLLTAAKLKYSIIGGGPTVTAQSPAGGTGIQKNGTVYLYTDTSPAQTATVPPLSGLTPEAVEQKLAEAKLNGAFNGLAQDKTDETAYGQGTPAGTKVPIGTVITVNFRDNNLSVDR